MGNLCTFLFFLEIFFGRSRGSGVAKSVYVRRHPCSRARVLAGLAADGVCLTRFAAGGPLAAAEAAGSGWRSAGRFSPTCGMAELWLAGSGAAGASGAGSSCACAGFGSDPGAGGGLAGKTIGPERR